MRRMAMGVVRMAGLAGNFGFLVTGKGNFAMRFRAFCGRQRGRRYQ